MQPFESINRLSLPPEVRCRMQELVRRQSQGKLSASERRELDLIIEAKDALDVIRAKAGAVLASSPPASIQPTRTVRNGLPVVVVPPGTPAIDPTAVRRFLEEQIF